MVAPRNRVIDSWRTVQERMAALYAKARLDPVLFNAAVLRDERTGQPIQMAPMHEGWHDVIEHSKRCVIWSHVEAGKTQQISVGRTLFEIGRDTNLRVAIVSNTHSQAEKIIRTVAQYIERSDELHKVFPALRPAEPWTSSRLHVMRESFAKDPSIQACGVHGNILGSRIDLLILDDILDYENCRTPDGRKELIAWYHATLAGRLTEDARVIVVGTAFNPDDLLHVLARAPGWKAVRYPVVNEATGNPNWPERWPLERIEQAKLDQGPAEFARQMLCRARSDEDAIFKWAWIERCLQRGDGRRMAYGLQVVPPGYRTVTGVDLGVQQHSAADPTVLFDIVIHPDETRELLSIESGRWAGPDIVGRLIDHHRRYNSQIIVENNAAQDFILQFARGVSAVPVRAFTTGRNKAHPEFGIQGIATEMSNAKWVIPNDKGMVHPEVAAWLNEMLYYDPRGHTGDRLMASWFAREGARMGTIKVESGRFDTMRR